MQGLATADWWLEGRGRYMERALGAMFDLPLATGSLEWVCCCEVLHHNHRANLWATMRELCRVLKPGGGLIVANETLRSLREPKLDRARPSPSTKATSTPACAAATSRRRATRALRSTCAARATTRSSTSSRSA